MRLFSLLRSKPRAPNVVEFDSNVDHSMRIHTPAMGTVPLNGPPPAALQRAPAQAEPRVLDLQAHRAAARRLTHAAEQAYDRDARVHLARNIEGNEAAWRLAFEIAAANDSPKHPHSL